MTDEAKTYKTAGAFRTALALDNECVLLWAIPSWPQWSAHEQALSRPGPLQSWQRRLYEWATSYNRFLMLDAPLSPMRIGRQPARTDRTELWDEA